MAEEEQPQGVEMDDDFGGALEDVPEAERGDGEEEGAEEGDDERLEQQMGEAGPDEQVGAWETFAKSFWATLLEPARMDTASAWRACWWRWGHRRTGCPANFGAFCWTDICTILPGHAGAQPGGARLSDWRQSCIGNEFPGLNTREPS